MKDVIIIGGGPAGLTAAFYAEKHHMNYLLLEKNESLGKKLLITGSGKCNVTNPYDTKEFIHHLHIPHKRFLYSTLQSFNSHSVKQFFEDLQVPLYLDDNQKYFPKSNKSTDILQAFMSGITRRNIQYNAKVVSIAKDNDFTIKTEDQEYHARHVIIATGSRSFPQTGSSGEGVSLLKKLGHTVIPFYPAETHVYANQIANNSQELMGISLPRITVSIASAKISMEGDLLFTHFGLSGPVIQSLSEFIYHQLEQKKKCTLYMNLVSKSEQEVLDFIEQYPNESLRKILQKILPKHLVRYLLSLIDLNELSFHQVNKKKRNLLIQTLTSYSVDIQKVEDVSKAYVNGGGIITKEINPKTMESKLVSGLYVAGEMLDVHGPIGGFNITIAMSTGYTAITSIQTK